MAPPTKTILFPHHPLSPKPRLDLCSSACNPTQNFFRFCPPLCIPLCPAFCQQPFPGFLHSPQPPPSVPTTGTGTDYRPHPHPHRHHDYLSPVFITMIILLASSFFLAVSYFIYFAFFSRSPLRRLRSNRRRVMEYDRTMEVMNFHPVWYIATVGLQRSTIDSIAVCSYKKGDGLVQEVTCPICLAEFQERDALRLLPKCCHAFHVPCIDTWLESHTNCPVCRASVLQANTNPQPDQEARVVEIAQDPSSSGEVRGEFEGVEALRPMRRAASMDSLCAELGEKMDTSSSGVNSLGERSLSCTGKLFSSSRNGFR